MGARRMQMCHLPFSRCLVPSVLFIGGESRQTPTETDTGVAKWVAFPFHTGAHLKKRGGVYFFVSFVACRFTGELISPNKTKVTNFGSTELISLHQRENIL